MGGQEGSSSSFSSRNLKAVLSSKKILDKNIQAKYLEIGRNQASVIAFQVEYLVLISPIKMVFLVVSKYKNRRNEGRMHGQRENWKQIGPDINLDITR